MKFVKLSICLPGLTLTAAMLQACSPQDHSELANHPGLQSPADITLTGPFDALIYNRVQPLFDPDKREFEAEYHKAEISVGNQDLKAKIRLRGGIRFCDAFPHFTIKMRDNDKLFGRTKYKLVTHGSHQIDPAHPVNAPSCGDQISGRQSGDYAGEAAVYQLAAGILDHHFKTISLNVTYRDSTSGSEVKGFAFLIEDMDDLAERYGADEHEYDAVHIYVSWKSGDTDDYRNALVGDEVFLFLEQKYRGLQAQHPEWSEKKLSAALPSLDKLPGMDEFKDIEAAAESRLPAFTAGIAALQKGYLAGMDQGAIFQPLLFNVMIGNTDWAQFGLNDHSAGTRNFKYVSKQGVAFPVAYDFDLSSFAEKIPVSKIDYVSRFQDLKASIGSVLGAEALDEFGDECAHFRDRVRSMLAASLEMPAWMRDSIETYLSVIEEN